jgi:hypothetical protein
MNQITKRNFKYTIFGQVPVAHSCNPSYSGGRDQEDCSLKPAWTNSLQEPILKNPSQKRTGRMAQCVGPEFKPQLWKKKPYLLKFWCNFGTKYINYA